MLFPRVLVRTCAVSFNHSFITENSSLVRKIFQQLTQLKDAKSDIDLSDALYRYIQEVDNQLKKPLIDIRRKIYNKRPLNEKELELLRACRETSVTHFVSDYCLIRDLKAQLKKLLSVTEEDYSTFIQAFERQDGLVNSLPLINPQLYKDFRSDRHQRSAKRKKLVRTLLKIFYRTMYKTSPVAELTRISITNTNFESSSFFRKPLVDVQFNTNLFFEITRVLSEDFILFPHLRPCLNSTLQETSGEYKFIVLSSLNRDTYVKMRRNDALDVIVTHLKAINYNSIESLTNAVNQEIDSTPAELIAYLRKLVHIGMIITPVKRIFNKPDWELTLLRFLDQKPPEIKAKFEVIYTFLQRMIFLKKSYAKNSATERTVLLEAMEYEIKQFYERLRNSLLPGLYDNLQAILRNNKILFIDFYENFHNPAHPKLDTFIRENIQLYSQYLVNTSFLKEGHSFFTALQSFHKHKFHLEPVNFFDFYTAYYEDYKLAKNSEIHAIVQADISAFENARSKKTQEMLEIIGKHYQESKHTIRIVPEELEHLKELNRPASAYGSHFQLLEKDGQMMLVENVTAPGYGKMMSRFLNTPNFKIVAEQQRQFNTAFEKQLESLFVEIFDGSVFNFNLHPHLFNHQLDVPGDASFYPERQKIKLIDLTIKFNREHGISTLYLGDKCLYTLDLNFQNANFRSHIFQTVYFFTNQTILSNKQLIKLLNDTFKHTRNDGVIVHPRISIGDEIIIKRKSWAVDSSIWKKISHDDPFETIQLLFDLGIPQKTFFKFFFVKQSVPHKKSKPMYFDFFDKFSLQVFLYEVKINQALLDKIVFYEMLPEPIHTKWDDRFREFLIQWYENSSTKTPRAK